MAISSISNNSKNDMTQLAEDFQPGPYDVICARGRMAKNHAGNIRYRAIIQSTLVRYSQADTKLKKSMIVSEVVDCIRRSSPDGGFVKKDEESGQWYEVGTHLAREKTSQTFRDNLDTQYKSSTKAKKRRREAIRGEASSKASSSASLSSSPSASPMPTKAPLSIGIPSMISPMMTIPLAAAPAAAALPYYPLGLVPPTGRISPTSLAMAKMDVLETLQREQFLLKELAAVRQSRLMRFAAPVV